MNKGPKILILDIETSPTMAFVWGLFKQNVSLNQIVKDMHILCWAGKWLNEDYIYYDSLHFHKKDWKEDPENDLRIVQSAWKMLDEADFVVAHNAKFDTKTLNSRFIQHGMTPPSHYTIIDTLRIARQNFRFTSNKLAFIGDILTDDRKLDPGGFETWSNIVLRQDTKAFDHMMEYNCQDVWLLEDVYNKLKPWDKHAPALTIFSDLKEKACLSCGSTDLKKSGFYHTNTAVYKKYTCKNCGKCMRERMQEKQSKEQKANLLSSI